MRILLILLFAIDIASAQNSSLNLHQTHQSNQIRYFNNKSISIDNYEDALNEILGLEKNDVLVSTRKIIDKQNQAHIRLQQYHKGLEVIGGQYVLHFKNEYLEKGSGNILPKIMVDIKPDQDWKDGVQKIIEQLRLSMKLYEYPNVELVPEDLNEMGLCVIDRSYPDFSGNYTLAYRFELLSEENGELLLNEEIYVDAHKLDLINHFSRVHFHRVKGVAKTRYYGEKEIYIDSLDKDVYLLKDRQKAIFTLNAKKDTFVNSSKYWNQVNEDQNEVAGDVHFGASAYHEFMDQYFNWNGLDGEGHELSSVVHARGKFYVNAYWDGKKANFGNGDCDNYGPLTSLDIVGHEFVHGFTDYTSDLIYRNESGALNEAISDIFGKALEYYYDRDNFNWKLGDRIRKHESVNYFRSMSNPNERNHPRYYGGLHWRTGSSDNGGVHSNSGVLNQWFYYLVEGGSDTNEMGDFFNVNAIGMEKAISLVFHLQTAYLTQSSEYFDAMYYSFEAVKDLFGSASVEMQSVREAWKAVGLFEGIDDLDLSIERSDDFVSVCLGEDYKPEFLVRNSGLKSIAAGTTLTLRYGGYSTVNDEIKILLNEDFNVGDSIVYQFDSAVEILADEQTLIYGSVSMAGEHNVLNNSVNLTARRSNLDGFDVSLQEAGFYYSSSCDDSALSRFRYRIYNQGCKKIAAEDTVYFDIITDKGNFTLQRPAYIDIDPGTTVFGTVILGFLDIPQDFQNYDVVFRHEDDSDPDNNLLSGVLQEIFIAGDSYFEGFDSNTYERDFDIIINDDFVLDTILELRSNRMLAIAANRDHSFFDNCQSEDDFFDEYPLKANLSLCIDTRDINDPVISFDLLQNRYSANPTQLIIPEYSAMVRLEFNENEEYSSPPIYGQTKNAYIHHSFDLPPDYLGRMSFDILCYSAATEFSTGNILDNRDVVLLDNIRINGRGERLSDYDENDFLVFPNPTSDIFRVISRNSALHFEYDIYDMVGRRLYSSPVVQNQHWLDISNYDPGIYTLLIHSEAGRIATRKIVKSD